MASDLSSLAQSPSEEGIELASSCLFCGNDEFEVEAQDVRDFFFKCDDGHFDYLRCTACSAILLRNRPVGERLLRAYASYYTHGEATGGGGGGSAAKRFIRSAYVRNRYAAASGIIDRLIGTALRAASYDTSGIDEQFRFAPKAPAKVLDYGCGSGEYLLRLHPLGHDLAGAEYDPQLIGSMAGRGIAIADVATLEESHWQSEFDHITLAHVLEHVPDPAALLRRLHGWLKPGGTLYLEVPNADATGLAMFGRYWRGLEAPRHFALPSQPALTRALEAAGFASWTQHINTCARGWVWAESLEATPVEDRAALQAKMAAAPPETRANAEFLTFVARKPDA